MWVKVDDHFISHPKVTAAAGHFTRNGLRRVVAVWLEALCYAGRHATDGFIPRRAAQEFHTDRHPLKVMDVMAAPDVRLLVGLATGYQIHDYGDYQLSATAIKAKKTLWKTRSKTREFSTACGNLHSLRSAYGVHTDPLTPPENGHNRKNTPGFEFSTGCIPAVDIDIDQDQRSRAIARALTHTKPVRRHLLRAAFAELDINPEAPDSVLADAIKAAAAQLRVDYHAALISPLIRAVREARR
jgi:hypothetical protein